MPPTPRFPSFAFGQWSIGVTSHKLVLSRNDRPDLQRVTLGWGNKSCFVDLHLTREVRSDSGNRLVGKTYRSLVTFLPSTLEAHSPKIRRFLLEHCVQPLLRKRRRYRPGWLARNGYAVTLQSQSEVDMWLSSVIPKRRGKYRIDVARLMTTNNYPDAFSQFYPASVLADVSPSSVALPLVAHRVIRGRVVSQRALMLTPVQRPDGRVEWWGFPVGFSRSLGEGISNELRRELVPHLTPKHVEMFEAIVDGLGLRDFESTRGGLDRVRAFLVRAHAPRADS
jgi:hypothetical protein